jgi:hypothetical protein
VNAHLILSFLPPCLQRKIKLCTLLKRTSQWKMLPKTRKEKTKKERATISCQGRQTIVQKRKKTTKRKNDA